MAQTKSLAQSKSWAQAKNWALKNSAHAKKSAQAEKISLLVSVSLSKCYFYYKFPISSGKKSAQNQIAVQANKSDVAKKSVQELA